MRTPRAKVRWLVQDTDPVMRGVHAAGEEAELSLPLAMALESRGLVEILPPDESPVESPSTEGPPADG